MAKHHRSFEFSFFNALGRDTVAKTMLPLMTGAPFDYRWLTGEPPQGSSQRTATTATTALAAAAAAAAAAVSAAHAAHAAHADDADDSNDDDDHVDADDDDDDDDDDNNDDDDHGAIVLGTSPGSQVR